MIKHTDINLQLNTGPTLIRLSMSDSFAVFFSFLHCFCGFRCCPTRFNVVDWQLLTMHFFLHYRILMLPCNCVEPHTISLWQYHALSMSPMCSVSWCFISYPLKCTYLYLKWTVYVHAMGIVFVRVSRHRRACRVLYAPLSRVCVCFLIK